MNNIYVDELPKCCLVCKLGCPEEQRCVDGFTMDCDYCGVNERPASCPLKQLSDRLAEEREKVVSEIRNKVEQAKLVYEWKGDEIHIEEILDQIKRGK